MIVKMNKLSIVGLMEERSAIVKALMKLGVVQTDEAFMTEKEREKALDIAVFEDATNRIAEIDEELRKIKSALDFLNENPAKEKIKIQKKELSYESFVDAQTYQGTWKKVFEVLNLQKDILAQKNKLSSLKNERQFLEVWQPLNIPLDFASTKTTTVLVGTLPSTADLVGVLKALDEVGTNFVEVIHQDKDQSYLCIFVHDSVKQSIEELLSSNGFSKTNFGKLRGTVQDNLKRVDDTIDFVEKEIQTLTDSAISKYSYLLEIEALYDYIYNMQERRKVRHHFLKTDKAFVVGGWTPADLSEKVKHEIESKFTAYVEIIVPDEEEETPVLLKNKKMVYPFEVVTEMYSLPSSKGIDPNAVMAPFYWIFFGLMLSDAGYGVLLTFICALAVWKIKTDKGTMMDKLLKLLMLGGISTVIWGALFGSWFGDLPLQFFGKDIKPLWFNPNNDPMKLLIWSFVFGLIHLFAGMALNAYLLIKRGKWLDAVFDIGLWYAVLIGITFLFLGQPFATIGKYMAIVGAIGLVLTQGRHEKLFIKKITSGILSLYGVTGYLSDVLSYSRLLALGLATGVIAQVINQLGILVWGSKNIITTILVIVILIGGHLFNISINVLGAYVHSSRLQYVEFFGKFYESGGRAFTPLKPKLKFLKLK